MGHRRHRQRKHFDGCSHTGFGKYCHYCRQLEHDRGEEDKAKYDAEMGAAEAKAQEEGEAKWAEQQMAEEQQRRENEQPPDGYGGGG